MSLTASVIVPTYKRASLLKEALASAAAQTMDPSEYEVIVVNDGGTGSARSVRSQWHGRCAFHYTRIAHAGLSAAVNRGLEMARGRFVTILPDDDMMLPNKLSDLCGYLDRHEADVVYSLAQYVGPGGEQLRPPPEVCEYLRAHPRLTWDHIIAGHGLRVHAIATAYRLDACREVGGWDVKLPTMEEFEFHLRLLHAGYTFHALEKETVAYRVHPGNKSAEYRKNRAKWRPYVYGKFFKGPELDSRVDGGLTAKNS